MSDEPADIFNTSANREKAAASDAENLDEDKLRQAQVSDLKAYLKEAKIGTVNFKEYKATTYQEEEDLLKEENEQDNAGLQERAPTPTEPVNLAPVYFYHPDHLGSSTFLTDANGNAYQFFINLPFGETMAQQLPDTYYRTPFKFNGKELDEETGLYYYGARYYDPKISIWLSVDPLAESFPNWNPYNYTMQNPINLVDPTGMSAENPGDGDPPKKGWIQRFNESISSFFNLNVFRDAEDFAASEGKDNQLSKKLSFNSRLIDGKTKALEKTLEVIVTAHPLGEEAEALAYLMSGNSDAFAQKLQIDGGYYIVGALLPVVSGKELKLITKVGGKFLDKKELAKRLGTTVDNYHDNIKPLMKKDFSKEMKKLNSTNPDFSPNDAGNVMLKNPQTGKTIHTEVPFDTYIQKQ